MSWTAEAVLAIVRMLCLPQSMPQMIPHVISVLPARSRESLLLLAWELLVVKCALL